MSEIRVRPLMTRDLCGIDSWIESNPTFREYGMTGEKIRSELMSALENSDSWLLAADLVNGTETRFVGFAWCLLRGAFGRSGYLRFIAVDPALKSQGVGRTLLAAVENEFVSRPEKSARGLFLLCTHTNGEARTFYEKLGYQKVGEIPDYLRSNLNELLYFKA